MCAWFSSQLYHWCQQNRCHLYYLHRYPSPNIDAYLKELYDEDAYAWILPYIRNYFFFYVYSYQFMIGCNKTTTNPQRILKIQCFVSSCALLSQFVLFWDEKLDIFEKRIWYQNFSKRYKSGFVYCFSSTSNDTKYKYCFLIGLEFKKNLRKTCKWEFFNVIFSLN